MTDAKHVKYFAMCKQMLPHQYVSNDLNQMTLSFFTAASLHLLDHDIQTREAAASWVYLHLRDGGKGFRGGLNAKLDAAAPGARYDPFHLPATYFALQILLTLRDDLKIIDAETIMESLATLQLPDGSFPSAPGIQDADTRFTYMAFAIRYIFKHLLRRPCKADFHVRKALSFVDSCRNHDGGFGACPGAESHAGLTWCAIAAIHLNDPSAQLSNDPVFQQTIAWLLQRQNPDGGFNGRFGKISDVCYCFWVSASCCMLGVAHLLDHEALDAYLASCVTPYGGFGKAIGVPPDLYHAYLGLCVANRSIFAASTVAVALSLSQQTVDFHQASG